MAQSRELPGLALVAMLLLTPYSRAQIHVNVHNDAGVDVETVKQARREAHRILKAAGTTLKWSHCGPEPCSSGKLYLQVRLYAPEAESAWRVGREVYGFALPPSVPEFGVFVGVFAQRVKVRARKDRISEGRLLGHVIAHEVGHLLLGAGAHGEAGIMTAPWTNKDIESMKMGRLLFLPKEGAIIRTNVEARLLARR